MSLEATAKILKDTLDLQSNQINPLLEITISTGCNKHCSYCFEGCQPAETNIEEQNRQLSIVEKLCSSFDHKRFGRLNLSFWGGEPLMNIEWLRKILERTVDYEFVDYHMFTNGTLYNRLKSLLENHNLKKAFQCGRFAIQVSHDGEPHHTTKRGYSSAEVIPMLDLLKKHSISFTLKATIAEDAIGMMPDCWKSYEVLYEKYGECISYAPAIDTSSELGAIDLQVWRRAVKEIAKLEFGFIKKHNHPLMAWFARDQKKFCDVRNSIHMHSDGNLYLCHGAPYLEKCKAQKFILGTTRELAACEDVATRLFSDKTIDISRRSKECIGCEATFCGVCHIATVDPSNYREDWMDCISKQKKRCELYREFGKIARVLKFALLAKR